MGKGNQGTKRETKGERNGIGREKRHVKLYVAEAFSDNPIQHCALSNTLYPPFCMDLNYFIFPVSLQ